MKLQFFRDHVDILLKNGFAYHCFCTEKRLELLRKEAVRMQEIPKYDNKCRTLAPDVVREKINKGEQPCIRFKVSKFSSFFAIYLLYLTYFFR